MTTPRSSLSTPLGSHLLAGVGTLTLAAALGLTASRPAHTAGGPVAASALNPLRPAPDTEAAHGPFQTRMELPVIFGSSALYYMSTFTVPAGKRLVLQGISANFTFVQNEKPVIALSTSVSGTVGLHNFAASLSRDNGDASVLTEQPMTVYADPDSTVNIRAYNIASQDLRFHGAAVTLTGYYVNVP